MWFMRKGKSAAAAVAVTLLCFMMAFGIISCAEKPMVPKWAIGLDVSQLDSFSGIIRKNGIEMSGEVDQSNPISKLKFIEFGKQYDIPLESEELKVGDGEEIEVKLNLKMDVVAKEEESFTIKVAVVATGVVEVSQSMLVKIYRIKSGKNYVVYSQISEDGGKNWNESKAISIGHF